MEIHASRCWRLAQEGWPDESEGQRVREQPEPEGLAEQGEKEMKNQSKALLPAPVAKLVAKQTVSPRATQAYVRRKI